LEPQAAIAITIARARTSASNFFIFDAPLVFCFVSKAFYRGCCFHFDYTGAKKIGQVLFSLNA